MAEMQNDSESFGWVAIKLAAVISMAFLLQNILPQYVNFFILDTSAILLRPWTLITYIFLHGSPYHLFSNMFALALFGSVLEKVAGWRSFLKVFFATGVFSGFVGLFFYTSMIGASGAVFGVMGVLAAIRPKMVVPAFGVPMPMIAAIILYALLALGGTFFPSDVANVGHLAGMSLGLLIGLAWRERYKEEKKKAKKAGLSDEEFREWEDRYMRRRYKRKGDLIVFEEG